jgi:hypothetical protein
MSFMRLRRQGFRPRGGSKAAAAPRLWRSPPMKVEIVRIAAGVARAAGSTGEEFCELEGHSRE